MAVCLQETVLLQFLFPPLHGQFQLQQLLERVNLVPEMNLLCSFAKVSTSLVTPSLLQTVALSPGVSCRQKVKPTQRALTANLSL